MKKFLLMLMAAFMAVNVMSAQVDTMYVKPGDALNFELVVDTVEYPVLKELTDKVSWFIGNWDITDEAFVKELSGKYYLDTKEATKGTHDGTYIYKFSADITTKADIEIVDTFKFVHIYSTPDIKSFNINAAKKDTIYAGDTVLVNVGVADTLDVTDIYLVNEDLDTLAHSNSLEFKYVPEAGVHNLFVIVSNPYDGDLTLDPRELTVIPKLDVESLTYFAQTGEENVSKTVSGSEMDVFVMNHDSVRLSVNTNIDDINEVDATKGLSITWNHDGKAVHKSIKAEGLTLVIPEYDKDVMDGTYNCIVADENETIFTATFNIESEWATGVEDIDLNEYGIVCHDGVLILDNVLNARIAVYNMLGTQLTTTVANNNHMELVVPRNVVLIVTINDTPIKVLSK